MANHALMDFKCFVSGGSLPPSRAFKIFNARLAVDYPVLIWFININV